MRVCAYSVASLQRAFRDADAARGDVDAAELEPAGGLVEALALDAADQMIGGHAIVLEDELGGVDRLVAELLQLAADREALHLRRDEKAHALVAGLAFGIGLDQQREARALDAVRDPGLRAVDDVVIAVAPRGHADALQVGAGIRLGQREAAANFARGELRQPGVFFCAAVPNFSIASASIRCELKMPVIDIQTDEMRMTILA